MNQPDEGPLQAGGMAGLMQKFALLLMFSLLLLGVYLVLKPFLLGLVLGLILAVAAWPVRLWLMSRGLSGAMTAGVMLAALLVFVLAPMVILSPGLALEVRQLVERGMVWFSSSPTLPDWITSLPMVGDKISSAWSSFLNQTPQSRAFLVSYAEPARRFVTDAAFGLAGSIMDVGVALFIATSFWSHGDRPALVLRDSLLRLGGHDLARLPAVAATATRGVFIGIVGTAAIQGLLMAIGLELAGVPGAGSLGFVTLLFAISQFGGILINLVWGGAAWWIYSTAGTMGLAFWFVVGWGLMVTFSDNVLKPMLIGNSLKLPMALVILGVFGGFVSFGFLGLFIGPTLLAVAFDLLAAWRGKGREGEPVQ